VQVAFALLKKTLALDVLSCGQSMVVVVVVVMVGGVTSAEPFEVEQLPLQEYLALLSPETKQTLFEKGDELTAVPEHAELSKYIRYIWPSMHDVGRK